MKISQSPNFPNLLENLKIPSPEQSTPLNRHRPVDSLTSPSEKLSNEFMRSLPFCRLKLKGNPRTQIFDLYRFLSIQVWCCWPNFPIFRAEWRQNLNGKQILRNHPEDSYRFVTVEANFEVFGRFFSCNVGFFAGNKKACFFKHRLMFCRLKVEEES